MLDPNRLRVFRTVVTEGSVHRAATVLGYTPSAVSQQVATLQRETGLALLERQGRGLIPTAAGLQLAEASSGVLAHLAELDDLARDLREGRHGRFTLSYIASAGAAWVPAVVVRLAAEFPGVRLDLRLNEQVTEVGFAPDLDIYVLPPSAAPPTGDGYAHHVVLHDPYVAVVYPGHPWAERDTVRLIELAGERLIDNDIARGPCRSVLLDRCTAAGFTPTFPIEAHDYVAALEFVAVGAGITVMPRLGVRRMPAELRAVPVVDPTPQRTLVLRVKESVRSHPVVVRAVELVRARAAADRIA